MKRLFVLVEYIVFVCISFPFPFRSARNVPVGCRICFLKKDPDPCSIQCIARVEVVIGRKLDGKMHIGLDD